MNKLLKFFFKLTVVIVLLTSILFILSKLLEQKIVNKAVTVLNNQLDVPVYVENISFSLINKFPNATLQLKNVTVLSAKDFNSIHFNESYADTFIFIKELFLAINMLSLIDNRLDLTKAYAQNGQINILVDKKGKENYNILKENQIDVSNDTLKNKLVFMLNHIQLKQIEIRFINRYKKISTSIYAPNYTLKGKFYKKEYTAGTKGELLLNYYEQGGLEIHPKRPADINIQLNVSNNKVEVVKSSIQAGGIKLLTQGIITFNPLKLDLKTTGSSNNIDELIALFNKNKIYNFTTNGKLGVSAIVKGVLSSKKSPAITVNFNLKNGSISEKKHHLNLDKIEFNGSYSNGEKQNISTSQIDIKNLLIATDSSSVTGSINVQNFNNPLVTINAKTTLSIADLDGWISEKSKYIFTGQIDGDFYCRGNIDAYLPSTFDNLQNWIKKGDFTITNGGVKIKKPELIINDLTAQLSIRENAVSVNNFKGNIQNSKAWGNITIDDLLTPIIDSTANYNIKANINTNRFYYNDYKYFFESDKPDNGYTQIVNLTGNFKADTLIYDKIVANNVSGKLNYINERLQITNISFNTMGGAIKGQVKYFRKNGNRYTFQTNTTTNNVNIKSVFANFNNFNQSFIKDENIDGLLTSNFDLEMIFNNGKVEPKSIELLGHLRIDNGKLIDFKSIQEVAKFSDMKELEYIEFSSLENDILISSSTINIPKMDIFSNAFDISLYGNQHFNGDYKYHIRIFLSDFLKGKSNRLAKQQSEFGYIEDDGFGRKTLYLVVSSKNSKTKVKLDADEIKRNMKGGIKEEKKEFKKVLHDEFGWFKNDTTLSRDKESEKKQEFIIEWDEE